MLRIVLVLVMMLIGHGAMAQAYRVVGWGENGAGQISVPRDLGDVKSVATAPYHSCAVDEKGQVRCWGCGDGFNDTKQCDPSKMPDGWHMKTGGMRTTSLPLLSIATGAGQSCGINSQGEVECWGCRPQRQLYQCLFPREPMKVSRPQPGLPNLTAGLEHTCAIEEDGRVSCWGCDHKPQAKCEVPPNLRAVALASGDEHNCAIDRENKVICWGDSGEARLKVPSGLRAKSISVGNASTCAIALDGKLVCWGSDAPKLCGSWFSGKDCLPEKPEVGEWVQVAVGSGGTCALSSTGEVKCGGCPKNGQGICAKPAWVKKAVSITVAENHVLAVVPSNVVPVEWEPPAFSAKSESDIVAARKKMPASKAWLNDKGDFTNHVGMRFRTVPAGKFVMGSCLPDQPCKYGLPPDSMAYPSEVPAHEVTITKPFQVGLFPVTVGEFKRFVKETSYPVDPQFWTINAVPDYYPVFWVTWKESKDYIAWLNKSKPDSDKGTYRLLTEAEYEYAARGGTKTLWWWGNEAMDTKNANCEMCDPDHRDEPTPVGLYPANQFGLYDILGNADTYVEDCNHDNYIGAPTDGSAWVDAKKCDRIARGGSWEYPIQGIRSAWRDFYDEDGRTWEDGFRVARTMP
jgi:formylglycine-generating enzyme required for sulfatase activity/alpha-tubulin suppressor-like RCC1 family protein